MLFRGKGWCAASSGRTRALEDMDEQELVKLYMQLTGETELSARNVFIMVCTPAGSEEPSIELAQSQTGKTRQQSKVLIKRKELEHRALPPNHGQFQEQAQGCGPKNGQVNEPGGEVVKISGLILGVRVDARFQLLQRIIKHTRKSTGQAYHQDQFAEECRRELVIG